MLKTDTACTMGKKKLLWLKFAQKKRTWRLLKSNKYSCSNEKKYTPPTHTHISNGTCNLLVNVRSISIAHTGGQINTLQAQMFKSGPKISVC